MFKLLVDESSPILNTFWLEILGKTQDCASAAASTITVAL